MYLQRLAGRPGCNRRYTLLDEKDRLPWLGVETLAKGWMGQVGIIAPFISRWCVAQSSGYALRWRITAATMPEDCQHHDPEITTPLQPRFVGLRVIRNKDVNGLHQISRKVTLLQLSEACMCNFNIARIQVTICKTKP